MSSSKNEMIRGDLIGSSVLLPYEVDISRLAGCGLKRGGNVELSLEEAAYLLERKRISVFDREERLDLREFINRASSLRPGFELKFLVYKDIRERGYHLRARPLDFRVYPRGVRSGEGESRYIVHVLSEREPIKTDILLKDLNLSENIKRRLLYAVVDEEGDITYYEIKKANLKGKTSPFDLSGPIMGDILDERVIIWDETISRGLNEKWWFGKVINDTSRLQLSFVESAYLIEKGSLTITGTDGRILSLNRFIEMASAVEKDFFNKYIVYRDLRDRGMVVKTGFKFGSHFRVYDRVPDRETYHSRYLVHLLSNKGEVWPSEISRAVRLAHGVKKQMVFAVLLEERVEYVEIMWVRL